MSTIGQVATWAYIARDGEGQRIEGRVTASDRAAAIDELQTRRLAPVMVDEVREHTLFQRRIGIRNLANAYRQLADLLRAGVPLLRGLQLLGRGKSNPQLAAVFNQIADEVAEGGRLADAMAARGDVFPDVHVAMVQAGERGGFLEDVLVRMSSFLEHQANVRSSVIGNLVYPFVLLGIGLLIIVFALVFFVPKFQDFYAKIDLPVATRILLVTSDILVHGWPWVLAGLLAIAFGLRSLMARDSARLTWARWQLAIPKIGDLVRLLAIARFARLFGTLLENGVPVLEAMQIARGAAGNPVLASAIEKAEDAVREGESLAAPLEASGMFDDEVVEMITVGETANQLPSVLSTVAETIERRVDRTLSLLVRLMEPALLLCMAGIVLFIFIALIVPMLRMQAAL